jgi:uncharacterized phage-associated protein
VLPLATISRRISLRHGTIVESENMPPTREPDPGRVGASMRQGRYMSRQKLDYNKFANTILYLLERSSPAHPGSTHLLKMLWYADYSHYRKHLRSITGAEYVAMERGPVLDDYKELFERLARDNVVVIEKVPVWGHPENDKVELRALMDASEAELSETERETLDQVIRECADKSGNWLSERSHREPPWMISYPVTPNGRIPYSLFRWIDNAPTEADLEKAKQALARPECQKVLAGLV